MKVIDESGLQTSSVEFFSSLRQTSRWSPETIEWSSKIKLDEGKVNLGWQLASQSAVAEEAGLYIAAKLAVAISDKDTRRVLAVQAAEEAKHSEAFERYAVLIGGRLCPASISTSGLLTRLDAVDNAPRLFAIHTFLEALALDQFRYLAIAFEGDALGEIYTLVRGDEANHVSVGIKYLRMLTSGMAQDERQDLADWCGKAIREIGCFSPPVYTDLARLTSLAAPDIEADFRRRYRKRCMSAFHVYSQESI